MPVYLTDQNSVTNFTELDGIPTAQGLVHKFAFNYSSPFSSSTPGPVAITGALSGNGSNAEANLFLTFANPATLGSLVPAHMNNFPLLVFYGPTTNPATFGASLNGQNVSSLFSPVAGGWQSVNLPLLNGANSITLQISGTTSTGPATDVVTLLFDVGGTAPISPSKLVAVAVSTNQINLSWKASSSSGITYSLFRGYATGFTPSASTLLASGLTSTNYDDMSLNPSATYYYLVEAVDPYASSAASNQASATTEFAVSGGTVSSIVANFNRAPISSSSDFWFNSAFAPTGLGSNPVTIFVRNSTITFSAGGTNYSVPAPNANIVFSPSLTTATAAFNTASNLWEITAPSTGIPGNAFLDGVEFQPPTDLPGSIKGVTWSAAFSTDTPGITLQWKWSAAVYTSFSTDYNALGIKPVDGKLLSLYPDSAHPGTPENYESSVIAGAMGGGGSNYTGSYCTAQPAPNAIPSRENLDPGSPEGNDVSEPKRDEWERTIREGTSSPDGIKPEPEWVSASCPVKVTPAVVKQCGVRDVSRAGLNECS
jgi:hypothetical protein